MTIAPQQPPIPLQIQPIFPLSQSGPPSHCTHPHPHPTWRAEARRLLWFIENRGGETRRMREREGEREACHHGNCSPVHNQFVAMEIPRAHLGLRYWAVRF